MADETNTQTSETTTDQTAETTAETSTVEAGSEQTSETAEASESEATALGGETEAQAADEGAEAKADIPEAYELTAPEGFEALDSEAVEAATPVFKELGLSNEQANKLMPVAGKFAERIIAQRDQQMLAQVATTRKDWLEAAKADEEVGGANWDASLASASKAMDQLGFPKGSPLRNYLNESGAGNHVELIRFMAKVGKAIGEDSDFVRGGSNAPVAKTDAELFYGKKD